MIETDRIPEEATKYHVLPFDKVGKDPSLCGSERPISLLNTFMKLLELIIVRRLMGTVEPYMADCQYAYQRQRSAEILLADLDSFVQDASAKTWATYLVGLDIEGAFDTANLIRLMEALDGVGVPGVLSRFIGNWMTIRSFRLRLTAPTGQYFSRPYAQTRGIPQGGVLSPLMWILLINGVPERIRGHMRLITPGLDVEQDLLIQIFADDISIALRGQKTANVAEQANKLGMILHQVLREIGLKLSPLKCKNFVIQILRGVMRLFRRGDPTSRWHKGKEKIRRQALKTQETGTKGTQDEGDLELPYQQTTSFKLLGLTMDNVWSFGGHMNDTQRKMKLRKAVLQKVSSSVWGLENRILTITVHALLESIFSYGLTVTGSAASVEDFESIDKKVFNPVARKVAGVGFPARREIIYTLADIRSAHNHYLLKVANVVDRTLRAGQTQAQRRMCTYLRNSCMGPDIWRSGREYKQVGGPVWPKTNMGDHWMYLWNKKRWDPALHQHDISWWQQDAELQNQKRQMDASQCEDNSIFHAQAEEIRALGNKGKYVFQYTGLTDWRSVACRALESIGWTTECAFESTLYPKRMENAGINWDNMTWSAPNPQRKLDTTDMIQVYIIAWEEGRLANGVTVIKYGPVN